MKTISVVSPCYMEEANVENCYRTVKAIFEKHLPEYRLEHIFVDNCSTDETVNILRELAQNDTGVKVVVNSRNFGSYRSAFNGLKFATGDAIVVLLPVDLQDPPELIPEFVKHWENGIEVVAGSRGEREEGFFLRNARRVFYRIVNGLSAFEIPSDVGEFQLVDRKVLDAMLRYNDHYPYIRGIIASCGFKRLIIPYVWVTRKRGISSSNLPIMIDQALNGIFSFTNVPMRLCTLVGFAISILCVVFSLFVMASYFFAPDLIPRGTTTIIVAVVLLSGIQLIFTGMLGEYVTSIHQQVRGGPLVIERETINIEPAINAPQNSGPVG
jgi:glycosyltransferase involved in cell wall biosynthesis